jgi:NAD(P)-dependent dehydrogenase (short-subunit alcohol dehydrogenase family)
MDKARKVAMISGASRGIGQEIAKELERRGYALSLGMRNPEAGIGALDTRGAHCFSYEARDPDAARHWVNAIVEQFGRIDVLVCSAGICKEVSLEEGTEELLEETLDINLKAPFRLVQAAPVRYPPGWHAYRLSVRLNGEHKHEQAGTHQCSRKRSGHREIRRSRNDRRIFGDRDERGGQGRPGSTHRVWIFQHGRACGPSGLQPEDRRAASDRCLEDRQVHRRQRIQGRGEPVGR